MKERVREAVFNLLGPAVKGLAVIDLFAGTGAMSFEAISRGAASAILIERNFPNVRVIEENAAALGIVSQVTVKAGDTFFVHQQLDLPTGPWLVFCCPPYALFDEACEDLLKLIKRFCNAAPPGSLIAVEADERFDFNQLPDADAWDVRSYPPAIIGIFEQTMQRKGLTD